MKPLLHWLRRRMVLFIILLAALLLEVFSAIQYSYSHDLLEQSLERNTLSDLTSSALRIHAVMSSAEVTASSQLWMIRQHLDDPDYMAKVVAHIVRDEGDNIVGAAMAFKPDFFPSKGRLYEPYARQSDDSIVVMQIGGAEHDYTQMEFFRSAMRGDTVKWTAPYLDAEGARGVVTTFALPIKDDRDEPVGILAVDLETDWINEVVNVFHLHPSSFSMVLTEDGELIAAPADSVASPSLVRRLVAMLNDSTVVKEEKANGRVSCFAFVDDNGVRGHVYYATKRYEPRWLMVTVCYDHEVFGKLEQMRRYMMWLALAGLVVLGIIIQLFRRNQNKLQETQMQQELISSELRIAREIQMHMLPRVNSITRSDVHVFGSLVPAREVGGDLFDFLIRDEKLFFCIGDVSGKGVPSALCMAVAHSLFRMVVVQEDDPARMMQIINEVSCEGNVNNMFLTFFIGVLDLATGRLTYSNAGHDRPLVLNREGNPSSSSGDIQVRALEAESNLPIGLFPAVQYATQAEQLTAGTTLFLYTDGLTEAKAESRACFGLERVKQVAHRLTESSPQTLISKMSEAVSQFVGEALQSDDLTMLAICYVPEPNTDNLTLTNELSEVARLRSFFKAFCQRHNIADSMAKQLTLALEEWMVNVINYAYPQGVHGEIEVTMRYATPGGADGNEAVLTIGIRDNGVAFDPTQHGEVDTEASLDDRGIGGLGIHLMRTIMDSMTYQRTPEGSNVLTLVKTIH